MMRQEVLTFMPLDLDTFSGSERFMAGTELGKAFNQGLQAYLHARYGEAVEHFKAALIAAYIGDQLDTRIGDRERAIIHLYIGNAWAFCRDWDAALTEYLEAVQTEHALAEAHYNMGVAFAAAEQYDQAVAAFKVALAQNPALYEAHFALGRCYQHLNDPLRAYIHYSSAHELRPQVGEPLYYMGLMHQSQGATELAQRSFAEALRIEPDVVSPDGEPDDLITRTDDETAAWYYRLAEDLKAQGYTSESERIYRALLHWRPTEYRASYLLGNLLARAQQWEDAVREYLHIPVDHGLYVAAQMRIAAVLRVCKHLKQAYTVLYQCAKLRPAEGQLLVQMAKILYDLDKPHTAARVLERAIQLLPKDAVAHYLLGFMYIAIGKEKWAIAVWHRAVQMMPHAWSLRYDLACMYIRQRRYELALTELTEVLAHQTNDICTQFMLGLCYRELLEPGRAIPLFEAVLKVQPQHVQALYYLGACYLQTGNRAVGRAYLRRYDRLAVAYPG